MKITLEINTANVQDVMDAINTLKTLAPRDAMLIEEAEYLEDVKTVKSIAENSDLVDFQSNEESRINEIEAEFNELKVVCEELQKEKQELKKERDALVEKISSLEIELSSTPTEPSIDDLLDGIELDLTEEAVSSENVKELEAKIKQLEKDVTFHENRSNKNFEEVKRLRSTVDNISSEKRNLEKKVSLMEAEIETLKNADISGFDVEELDNLKKENESLTEKVNSFDKVKDKLNKEIEFQKNRSKTNWEDLKTIKASYESLEKEKNDLEKKVEELKVNSDNINYKEDIEKFKSELIQAKSEYESVISELRLHNDKLQNEINLCKTRFSDEDVQELAYLKKIKKAICGNERGASFWNGVEASITNQ